MSEQPDNQDALELTGPIKDEGQPATESNPVAEAIGMEARVMAKGVRLSPEGELTDAQRREIRSTVQAHIKQHGLLLREVAQQISYSESVVSEVIRDKYKRAGADPILRKLNAWVDDDERRRSKRAPLGFYRTTVFETILALAKYAKGNARLPYGSTRADLQQDLPRIAIGWGPAGCGKTIGARALSAEDPLSILIRVEQGAGTASGLCRLICEAAGWRGTGKRRSNLQVAKDKLKDSGRLLIIDEAHRLSRSGCEYLRDLADVCGIPVLLLATKDFYVRVTRVRTLSGDLFNDQFASRVGISCDLLRGMDGQGGTKRPIFSIDEIRGIFTRSLVNVKLTPDAEEFLCAAACVIGNGMLRMAASICEKAVRSALRGSKIIDARLLYSAAENLLLPAGDERLEILQRIQTQVDINRDFAGETRAKAVAG